MSIAHAHENSQAISAAILPISTRGSGEALLPRNQHILKNLYISLAMQLRRPAAAGVVPIAQIAPASARAR